MESLTVFGVRISMRLSALLVSGGVLYSLLIQPVNADVSFEHVLLDSNGPSPMHTKTAGDLSGDGYADLLVAGTNGQIVWYQYPNWTKHTITSSGGWSTDAEIADIDGDGDQDLVVSDWYNAQNIVWFENTAGDGSNWLKHIIGTPRAHDIEVADLDGDGDLDIVTRQQSTGAGAGGHIELWRQNSPTNWTHRTFSFPSVSSGEGLTLTDLNGDTLPDVLIASYWYENTGDIISGNWIEHQFSNTYNWSRSFAVAGDVNGDGRLDIVMTPSEESNEFYRTSWFEGPVQPGGIYTEHVIDSNVEAVTHSLALADIDLDGDLDVVTAEMHQGGDPDEVRVYYNNNAGSSFTKQVVATGGSHSIRVLDVGNDGDYDIFGANWQGSNAVSLWENKVDPSQTLPLNDFTYLQIDNVRTQRAFGLTMRDLTADGLMDIASGRYFYRNPGGAMDSPWQRTTFTPNVDALLAVDVDGDVFGDLIAMDQNGGVFWLEAQNQNGSEWASLQIGDVGSSDHNLSSQGYKLADIIAGGKPEIVINVNSLYYFQIPALPSAGSWPRTTVASVSYPEDVAVGDIDGDGDIDLAGTTDSTTVAWYENPGDGAGNWSVHVIGALPSQYADRFYTEDLNADSRKDLVVSAANGAANGVYWFQAPPNPSSSNWTRHTIVLQDTTNSLDVADMDNDGDIDVISGEHRGPKRVAIWENDGLGAFVEHIVDAGKESHLGSRVADLDNDGDLDIVSIAWDSFQFMHVWRNNANSNSGEPPAPTPTTAPPPPPPGSDPVGSFAAWPLNEGSGSIAHDASENGHDGTIQGASWVPGRYGSALDFNGGSSHVAIGALDISGQAMTIALWFKADNFNTTDARLVSKSTGTANEDHYWMISTVNHSGGIKLRFRLKAGGQTTELKAGTGNLSPGVWTHVAAVYDGSEMRIYKDGVLAASTPKSGELATNSNVLANLGRNPDGYGGFDGIIDEVMVFNGALSAQQIDVIKEGGSLVEPTPTATFTPTITPTVAMTPPPPPPTMTATSTSTPVVTPNATPTTSLPVPPARSPRPAECVERPLGELKLELSSSIRKAERAARTASRYAPSAKGGRQKTVRRITSLRRAALSNVRSFPDIVRVCSESSSCSVKTASAKENLTASIIALGKIATRVKRSSAAPARLRSRLKRQASSILNDLAKSLERIPSEIEVCD